MRILLALEPGGGGVARHVVDLASGLLARGHDVEIAYAPGRAEQWYLDALQSLGAPLHPLSLKRAIGWHDMRAVGELRRLLKNRPTFDIVHAHSSKAGAILRLAAVAYPARRVYTSHALVTMSPELPLAARIVYGMAERVLAPLAHGIICVSDEERQHARSLGIAARRLHVINNGMGPLPPVARAELRRELQLADSDVCIAFVGRLAAQKAAHRTIAALAEARTRCSRLCLLMVGDGEQRAALQEQAERLGIGGKVRFTSDSNGARLMAACDLFALSSHYEAFPYVFLEAAARGLPIVTTDVGGAAAVVSEGVNGYIVPQHRLELFAGHLARLGNDPELRARMSAASRNTAQRFSLDNMVEQTLDTYRALLDKPRALALRDSA
jgi:glycosyltransferase involved in cell wall biosynthesis